MEGIQINVDKAGSRQDIAVVGITGYIDTTTSSELEHVIQNLLREQKFKIIVDLENVDYISSAGWGIFISEIKNIRQHHGDLKLAGMADSVKEVYELLEFSTILTAAGTVAEAIRMFGDSPAAAAPAAAPAKPAAAQPARPATVKVASTPVAPAAKPSAVKSEPAVKAPAPAPKPVTLADRVLDVVKSNPGWGAWRIKNELNRQKGAAKVGWGDVKQELKRSGLNKKADREKRARE